MSQKAGFHPFSEKATGKGSQIDLPPTHPAVLGLINYNVFLWF